MVAEPFALRSYEARGREQKRLSSMKYVINWPSSEEGGDKSFFHTVVFNRGSPNGLSTRGSPKGTSAQTARSLMVQCRRAIRIRFGSCRD